MKKKKIFIPIVVILLVAIIFLLVFKLPRRTDENNPTTLTGEIVEVLDKGYKIEVDNLSDEEAFINVTVNSNALDFKEKDYVKVTGNNYNSKKKSFDAKEIVKTSYIEEYSPTVKSKELGNIDAEYGYIITLDKIELSEIETRLYVTVLNMGESKIDLSLENSIIIQNEKEYKYQPNLKAKYTQVDKQVDFTKESKGIITFPKLEEGIMTIKLKIISSNKEEQMEDYVFEIGL